MTVYYFKEDLRNVTEMYFDLILTALKRNGVDIREIPHCTLSTVRTIPQNCYCLSTTLKAFALLYLTGHRRFIYWYQGMGPEEIYMLMGSKLRYWVECFLEKLSLRRVQYKIGVSKYLFEHFEKKYHLTIDYSTVFLMPCFNSELNKASFGVPNKYERNVFCYAGGTQPWQGFGDIVLLYKQIEERWSDVFLKVYSKDKQSALEAIEQSGLKHYSIDCVPQEQMDSALSSCKFGFILREDTVINNVATPTKLATYLGSGVIPIFTSTVWSYRDLASKYDYLCCIDKKDEPLKKIEDFLNKKIVADDVFSEYEKIFEDYYNKEKYIANLRLFLQEMVNN